MAHIISTSLLANTHSITKGKSTVNRVLSICRERFVQHPIISLTIKRSRRAINLPLTASVLSVHILIGDTKLVQAKTIALGQIPIPPKDEV